MQKRQVDLKLNVGVTLPLLPALLQKHCQYITVDITVTGPASVPNGPPGKPMEYLQLAPSHLLLSWALKAGPQQIHAWGSSWRYNPTQGLGALLIVIMVPAD